MKKILFIAAAVAGLFTAASCQKDLNSGEAKVNLTVELPDAIQTKAIAQAETVDVVYYEIWNADWSKQLYPVNNETLASAVVTDKAATIDLVLILDQTYNFIFWAQDADCGAYDVSELKNVKIDYSVMAQKGNQDIFDAFYAVQAIEVTGSSVNKTVTLKRPFAQLNLGASEMTSSFGAIEIGTTAVKVSGLAKVFDTVNGVGTTEADPVTFSATGLATTDKLVAGGNEYAWITMDYMCMMGESSTVEVTAGIQVSGIGTVSHSISAVPVKKNFRTNIVGDLFTSNAKLDVIVDPAFEVEDENIIVD